MYSNSAITTLQFTISVGYKLKLFPFKLVINPEGIPELQPETNKWQLILWKFSIVYFVGIQEVYLGFGIWFDLSNNIEISERAQFYILVPAFIMGICGLLLNLIFWEKLIFLFNSLLLFGHKLHAYHGTTKISNDGIQIPLKVFVVTMCTVSLLAPLVTLTWIVEKVHLWSIMEGDINPISIMLCMGVPSIVFADSSAIFFLVALGINYIKITETSLNMMKYNSEKLFSSKKKRELINIYRAHRIYNNMCNEELRGITLIGISTGALNMIVMSYALIGFSHILPVHAIAATAGALILTFFVDYYCLHAGSKLAVTSEAVPSSFLCNDTMMKKVHKHCFTAFRPLYIKIGDVAKMDKLTFIIFMDQVVIARVVDLLLMYR